MPTRTVCMPSRLRNPVTVEKSTITRQGDGTWSPPTWVSQEPNPIWAQVHPLRGQELIEAQAVAATATLRVTIRAFTGLEPTQYRFKFGTRMLNILSVLNHEERGVWMIVLCGEDVSDGS